MQIWLKNPSVPEQTCEHAQTTHQTQYDILNGFTIEKEICLECHKTVAMNIMVLKGE